MNDNNLLQGIKSIYENIGKLMSDGIAKGQKGVRNLIGETHDGLLKAEKQYLDEKKRLQAEYDAAEEENYRRNYEIKLRKAKTAEQAETVRRNESLRLQKKANDEYLSALKESLEEAEEMVKSQKEQIVNEFQVLAERAADSLGRINEAREEMVNKLSAYGGIYRAHKLVFLNTGPGGSKEVYDEMLPDLKQQKEELERYTQILQDVQKLEVLPPELFDAIRKLSVKETLQLGETLLQLKPEELAAYVEDWKAIALLSQNTANESYAEETKSALHEIEEELSAWYGSIPADFFQEGELSAEAFGNAFVNKLFSMQEMLQDAVKSVLLFPMQSIALDTNGMGSTVNNVQHSTTYVLNGSGESVAEQLRSASQHAEIEKLRGGYDGITI